MHQGRQIKKYHSSGSNTNNSNNNFIDNNNSKNLSSSSNNNHWRCGLLLIFIFGNFRYFLITTEKRNVLRCTCHSINFAATPPIRHLLRLLLYLDRNMRLWCWVNNCACCLLQRTWPALCFCRCRWPEAAAAPVAASSATAAAARRPNICLVQLHWAKFSTDWQTYFSAV